jgi:hypothetical protein
MNLTELDIAEVRPRKTVTGVLILEMPDREGGQEQAQRMAELRGTGIDDWVTLEEVMTLSPRREAVAPRN